VQDAAYDSLLKIEGRSCIARSPGQSRSASQHFKTTEPEVLRNHLTAPARRGRIPLWARAGELAMRRVAPTEAISHLTRALEVLSTLAPSGGARSQRTGAAHAAWAGVDRHKRGQVEQLTVGRVLCPQMGDTPADFSGSIRPVGILSGRAIWRRLVSWWNAMALGRCAKTQDCPGSHRRWRRPFISRESLSSAHEDADARNCLYDPPQHSSLASTTASTLRWLAMLAAHTLWCLAS